MFKRDLAEDFIRETGWMDSSVEEALKRAYRITAFKLNTEALKVRISDTGFINLAWTILMDTRT